MGVGERGDTPPSLKQAPCPISRAKPQLKTPQNRYCKPPAGPQHKARLLIKSWNGPCQGCLQGCPTIAVLPHAFPTQIKLLTKWTDYPKLGAIHFANENNDCAWYSTHAFCSACQHFQLRGSMASPLNPFPAKTNKPPSFLKPPGALNYSPFRT